MERRSAIDDDAGDLSPDIVGTGAHLSTAELRAWTRFLDAGRLIEDVLATHVRREHDMNHAEYEVLVRLDGAKGRMRMTRLASQVVATPSRLTYTVDRLELRGWVQRRSLASDGRVVVAELTPEGRAALADAAVVHAELIRRHLLSHLDPAETDALAAAMGRVIESVRDGAGVSAAEGTTDPRRRPPPSR